MTEKPCPICHAAIPENAPGGFCPACLLRDAGEPAPVPGRDAPSLEEIAAAFPQLEVLSLIGRGGMGFVYQARQPGLDRMVALKILAPELSRDPSFEERFAREARALAKLSHPNIVAVFEHGQCGGFFYLLMEYVDGVNLRQAMQAGRFSPDQALAIVPAICDALQTAHAQGVWHRDIKPENILLDRHGRVKIADFGIARIAGDGGPHFTLTRTGGMLGSAAYMAPEQHEKPHDVDHRADIYSLGVVIYEMLTGELPLGRFPLPSQRAAVDARIDEIVLRTLEKERELRQQSAGEVKTEVQGATNGRETIQHKASAGRTSRAALAFVVAAVFLGVAGVAIHSFLNPGSHLPAEAKYMRVGYSTSEFSDLIKFAFFHPRAEVGGTSITIPLRVSETWFGNDEPLLLTDGSTLWVRGRVSQVERGSLKTEVGSSMDRTTWQTREVSLDLRNRRKSVAMKNGTEATVVIELVGDEFSEVSNHESKPDGEPQASTAPNPAQPRVPSDSVEDVFRQMNTAANGADSQAFARYAGRVEATSATAETMMPFLGKIGFLRQIDPKKHWPGVTTSIPERLLLVSWVDAREGPHWLLFGYRSTDEGKWRYTECQAPYYRASAVVEFRPKEGDAEAILRSHLAPHHFDNLGYVDWPQPVSGEKGVFKITARHQSAEGAASNADYAVEELFKTLKPFGLDAYLKVRSRAEIPAMPWIADDGAEIRPPGQ